ncbi:unnamed protein product [Gongylonema pulchrum]|uniref:GpcrRhopsn4 domain-containing protein n=1 Tax=Gongylonema pulchrum TaxID=637853 RepID=A0A183CXZ8_9BILA|nr:unnamed protein product [Gongylonema pulchrum]
MTFWFWMGPISIMLANFFLDNWVREEVVNLVDCSVTAYGFTVFMILTWPSSANVNFPYHVRTSQVGDSSCPADEANYPQNAYEVSVSKLF